MGSIAVHLHETLKDGVCAQTTSTHAHMYVHMHMVHLRVCVVELCVDA